VTGIYLGLGGNQGDVASNFRSALSDLERNGWCTLVRVSSLWGSPSWGFEGPDFLNAVAEIQTDHPPQRLLAALLDFELQCGRQRQQGMSSRPIDLDLLVWGDRQIDEPGLTLPHPGTPTRRFVLEPLYELESGLVLPGLGRIEDHIKTQRRADPQVWKDQAGDRWLNSAHVAHQVSL